MAIVLSLFAQTVAHLEKLDKDRYWNSFYFTEKCS